MTNVDSQERISARKQKLEKLLASCNQILSQKTIVLDFVKPAAQNKELTFLQFITKFIILFILFSIILKSSN